MKLLTGKRIGQSGRELTAAVLFSFFIHIIVIFAALFLYVQAVPRVFMPPFYRVNLVNLPADAASPLSQPSAMPPVAVEKPKETKTKPPTRAKAKSKAAAVAKGAMPELKEETSKKEKAAEEGPASQEEAAGRKQEAVVVASTTAPHDPLFASYIDRVRAKVEQNWNPPPGAKGSRAKVEFTILRSGMVGSVNLLDLNGNYYFGAAATRAILSSSPFPPFPEGFYKESEVFNVDLMERE